MRTPEVRTLLQSCNSCWERLRFLTVITWLYALLKTGNTVNSSCAPNFYEDPLNKTLCLPCGTNSVSPSNGRKDKCLCLTGYFRPTLDANKNGVACEKPPGLPEQLKVSQITSKSAFLSWSPPKETGTGDNVTYSAECITCAPVITYGSNLKTTNLSLSLSPATPYIFEVSSVNNVTKLLGRRQSTKVSFTTSSAQEKSSTSNWQWILIAFLIPTAVIIFLALLYQRLKVEKTKKKVKRLEEEERKQSRVESDHLGNLPLQEIVGCGSNGNVPRKSSAVNDDDNSSYINIIKTEDSGRRTQLPDSGGRTQLPGSGGRTQLPDSGGRTQLPDSGERTQLPESGERTRPPDFEGRTQPKGSEGSVQTQQNDGDSPLYVNIDRFEIPRENLQFGRPIGEGFFGSVYIGTASGLPDEEGTVEVAIKTIKEDMIQFDEDFLHELQILRTLENPHKNIIKLLACCTKDGPSHIVLEYVNEGDLWNYLKRNMTKSSGGSMITKIPFFVKLKVCKMIAEGMEYLDQNNIIHRDLACRNVLLNKDLEPKISDFGLARKTDIDGIYCKGPKMAKLPLQWMAPESVLKGIYTTKSDVWSYGIVLWEISCNGERPYPGFQSDEMPTVLKSKYRMEQPEYCPDAMYSVMMACWEEEAENRPTFTILKNLHMWTFGAPTTV